MSEERIDFLERQVYQLALGIRIGIAVGVVAAASRCCMLLAGAPRYEVIYEDILGGAALPAITLLVLEYYQVLMLGVVAVTVGAIAVLLFLHQRTCSIPVGVVVLVLLAAVSQAVAFGMTGPMQSIIFGLSS